MKKTAILAFIIALAFLSCDDFYGSSFGSSREYDWRNIHLTTSNVSDWVQATVGNPPLADAVTLAIDHKLAGDLSPGDRAIFLRYASRLAMEASGVGTSLLLNATEHLGSFVSNANPEDLEATIREMLDGLQRDFKANGGPEAAERLARMVNSSISRPTGIPRFDQSYISMVGPTDVAEAVIVLVLGELEKNDYFEIDSLDDLDHLGLELSGNNPPLVKVTEGSNPEPGAIAIAAYLNLIAENQEKFENNPLTKAINDVLITQGGDIGGDDESEL